MEKAVVLINTVPGAEDEVYADLKKVAGVMEVRQLYGLYDLLVVVEAADNAAIKSVISNQLRGHPKVVSTLTMKVVGS